MFLPRIEIYLMLALSRELETSVSSLNIQKLRWVLVANILSLPRFELFETASTIPHMVSSVSSFQLKISSASFPRQLMDKNAT
jgi:hypothetical protein